MADTKYSFVFLMFVFALCDSAFVDTLFKCSIRDNECQRKLINEKLRGMARTGEPEFGIPVYDPYVIRNISAKILGLVEIGMVDGTLKGIKDCVVTNVNTTIEEFISEVEVECDVTLKGKYKASAEGPLVENLLGGGNVRGDGYAKLRIDKMKFTFLSNFYLREENGEIYIDCDFENFSYSYDIGKMSLFADNVFVGGQDVSNVLIPIFNSNWKFIMDTFGKPFMDVAVEIIYQHYHSIFVQVPAKYYLLEDMREFYTTP